MDLAPKLSNTPVLKQLSKYSLYKQKFWIHFSFLAGLCVIFLLYKSTLNGQLEIDHHYVFTPKLMKGKMNFMR